jgi:prevent-host-death family protein
MERVSVATLKSKLSQYLEAVQKGQEIIVTSHQHPVARLLPLEKSPAAREIAAPAIRPISSLRKIKGTRLKFDPVEYLLEDRRRR